MKQRAEWTDHIERRFAGEKPEPKARPFKLTPYEIPERDVLASVLEFLRLHPQVGAAWRQNTGAGRFVYPDGSTSKFLQFGFPGSPDIHGFMIDGKALFAETKAEGGKMRKEQIAFIENAKEAGCVAFFAKSVTEAVDALREFGYSRMG